MKMPGILVFISLIGSSIFAQPAIHVTQEPYHKPVYVSDSLTVIELYMEKGDTSMFHLHTEPILYLTLNGAKMWLNSPEKNSRVVELNSGWIGSDNYGINDSFTHQIAVADGGPLHLVAILKNEVSEFNFPGDDDAVIYRDNGFAVKLDSAVNSLTGPERVNIVLKGSAFKDQEKIGPGDFFLPGEKLSKPSERFRYYRVFF